HYRSSTMPSCNSSFFLFLLTLPRHPRSPLFPYTTLFRSKSTLPLPHGQRPATARTSVDLPVPDSPATSSRSPGSISTWVSLTTPDRKSTRLNSSHGSISYAVFCLKKKTHRVI